MPLVALGLGALALKKILKKSGGQTLNRGLLELQGYGQRTRDAGTGIADEGLAGIRDLDRQYTDRLNSGQVLPASVYNAYKALRGQIGDTTARDTMSLTQSLAQRNAQSGGRMSPEALAELQKEGEQSINDSEFTALQGVGVDQAHTELAETNKLNDRIEAARSAILGAGEFRQQLGQQALLASLLAQLDKRKARAANATGIFQSALGLLRK